MSFHRRHRVLLQATSPICALSVAAAAFCAPALWKSETAEAPVRESVTAQPAVARDEPSSEPVPTSSGGGAPASRPGSSGPPETAEAPASEGTPAEAPPPPAEAARHAAAGGSAAAPVPPQRAYPDWEVCTATAASALKGKISQAKGAAAYEALRGCLKELIQAGRIFEALALARVANDLFPGEPQSGFDLGALLLMNDRSPEEAHRIIQSALKRTGRFTKASPRERALALSNLGRIDLAGGDATQARARLEQALAMDGSAAEAHYNLAALEQQSNNAAACLAHVEKALAMNPAIAARDDYLVAAWAYNRLNRSVEAIALMRRGIEAHPNEPGLHLNLGISLAREGRPVEALLEYLYEFQNASADDASAKQARLLFTDGLGRPQATPPHAAAIIALRSAISEKSTDPDRIVPHLKTLEEAGYRHPTIDLLWASALYAVGQIEDAEKALRELIESDPAFLPPYYDLSIVLRTQGRFEEAARLVAQAVKRNPAHWQLTGLSPADASR